MLEVEFRREKETKNTIRFEEVESETGDPPVIGALYLQKWAVKRLGDPQKLKVTVDAR